MQIRTILISVVVAVLVLTFLRPKPYKSEVPANTEASQATPTSPDSAGNVAPSNPIPNIDPTTQQSPQGYAQPTGATTEATATSSSPAPIGNQSVGSKTDAQQDFNAQLDAATAEAAANPDAARTSALTAKRAAKLKAVRAAQAREE